MPSHSERIEHVASATEVGQVAPPDAEVGSRCTGEVVVVEKPCDRAGGVSNVDKWIIAAIIAVIFIVLACPLAFRLTNALFSPLGFPTSSKKGRPTLLGLFVHAVIFFVVIRLLMH
jgi:hypothetical protein